MFEVALRHRFDHELMILREDHAGSCAATQVVLHRTLEIQATEGLPDGVEGRSKVIIEALMKE